MLPFFKIKNNETHHKRRYQNNIQLAVYFYSEITAEERETAKKLVKANCANFYVRNYEILFSNSLDELCKEVTTI